MSGAHRHRTYRLVLAAALGLIPLSAAAKVTLPLVFADHAVLQRDQPLRIWGWSTAGTSVTVTLDGGHARATAGKDGRWLATLPAHAAGGPFELTVDDGSALVTRHDILLGDVFLASGQSNMEFELRKARNASAEIARATDGAIREFKVPHASATSPSTQLPGGSWVTASPATAGEFSAVAYFFAREIRADRHVPIGIVNSSWGGSRIEPWMDAATAHADPAAIAARVAAEDKVAHEQVAATRLRLARWPTALSTPRGKDVDYSATAIDEHDWADIVVPAFWETRGYDAMDGVAWYRTTFDIDAGEAQGGVTLGLAMIDDSDRSFVNGQLIGHTEDAWNGVRAYKVAPGILHAGRNTLAIRVDDLGAGGGIHGEASQLFIQDADGKRRPLLASWKFRPSAVQLVPLDGKNQIDTLLYNKMIYPLLPLNIRGVLWYQGEQNATDELAFRYRDQFVALIDQWRRQFLQPTLPFLFVQLANFRRGTDTASASPWAMLRESQAMALARPATAQAVTIDVGNPDNIHPTDKQTVGHRLALAARHVIYGEDVHFDGPRFVSMHTGGGVITVRMDAAALATRGGVAPGGFAIAGADRVFHAATARIDGTSIVVEAAQVPAPVAVRYGWQENPSDANLIDASGLPASPFRTDTW